MCLTTSASHRFLKYLAVAAALGRGALPSHHLGEPPHEEVALGRRAVGGVLHLVLVDEAEEREAAAAAVVVARGLLGTGTKEDAVEGGFGRDGDDDEGKKHQEGGPGNNCRHTQEARTVDK